MLPLPPLPCCCRSCYRCHRCCRRFLCCCCRCRRRCIPLARSSSRQPPLTPSLPCSCPFCLVCARLAMCSLALGPATWLRPFGLRSCSPGVVCALLVPAAWSRSFDSRPRSFVLVCPRPCSFRVVCTRSGLVVVVCARLGSSFVPARLCWFPPVCVFVRAGPRYLVTSFGLHSCSFVCITYTVSTHIIIEKLTFL
jgi:hypothetical protein